MRKTCLGLALTLLLAGCAATPLMAVDRAAGGFAAAGKAPGGKTPGGKLGGAPSGGAGKRDAGKLVSVKPASPLAANVASMFRVMDGDGDGAISAAEWPYDEAAIVRGATPHATPDKDRDGRIGEAEWTAFGMARFKDAPFAAVDAAEVFGRVDLDASEQLTADEVGLFIRALAPRVRDSLYLDSEPVSAWVKAADLNRDFAVERSELERLLGRLMVKRFGDVG